MLPPPRPLRQRRVAFYRRIGRLEIRRKISVLTRAIGVSVAIGLFPSASSATAELMKVSVPQRGQWDTAVTELGTRGGVFKKYGLDIEVLYTQSGPESHQTVI